MIYSSPKEACEEADAVILLTDWEEFNDIEWNYIYKSMRKPAWVFDTRICANRELLLKIGFKVWTLGS